MLSGYLVGSRKEISISYCEQKIKNVVFKLFGWIIFWTIVSFVYTNELYDIWDNMTQSIISQGIEPVAWFLFTYCIIMLAADVLCKFYMKKPILFIILSIIWILFLALGLFDFITKTKTQSLWLHIYLGYFLCGMIISKAYAKFKNIIKPHFTLYAIIFLVITSVIYFYEVFIKFDGLLPNRHYGKWYYSIWLISLFITCLNFNLKNKRVNKLIYFLGNNTFTVYLGHLPILYFLTTIRPLESTLEACLCIIFLFVVCQIMAEVFKHLPLLRKII